jgi:hypothetical protein
MYDDVTLCIKPFVHQAHWLNKIKISLVRQACANTFLHTNNNTRAQAHIGTRLSLSLSLSFSLFLYAHIFCMMHSCLYTH